MRRQRSISNRSQPVKVPTNASETTNKPPGCEEGRSPHAVPVVPRGHPAPHRVPREIEIRTELPKNLIGKVLRRKLVEEELAKRQASAPDTAPEV